MPVQPWRRELGRYWRKRRLRPPALAGGGGIHLHPVLVTLLVGAAVALVTIKVLEARLRPVLEEAARTQAENQMAAVVEQAAAEELAALQRADAPSLVSVERDAGGAITALTTDTAELNLLRTRLVDAVLEELEGVEVSAIRVPLGSLLDSELIWARGPSIQARAMSVGTISAEFDSDFTSAGVNQTLYRIWLDISVPLTVMLPGGGVQVELNSRLCVSETVIVGSVPSTYLQMEAALP